MQFVEVDKIKNYHKDIMLILIELCKILYERERQNGLLILNFMNPMKVRYVGC